MPSPRPHRPPPQPPRYRVPPPLPRRVRRRGQREQPTAARAGGASVAAAAGGWRRPGHGSRRYASTCRSNSGIGSTSPRSAAASSRGSTPNAVAACRTLTIARRRVSRITPPWAIHDDCSSVIDPSPPHVGHVSPATSHPRGPHATPLMVVSPRHVGHSTAPPRRGAVMISPPSGCPRGLASIHPPAPRSRTPAPPPARRGRAPPGTARAHDRAASRSGT